MSDKVRAIRDGITALRFLSNLTECSALTLGDARRLIGKAQRGLQAALDDAPGPAGGRNQADDDAPLELTDARQVAPAVDQQVLDHLQRLADLPATVRRARVIGHLIAIDGDRP